MTMDLRLTYVQNNLPALHTLAIIDALHEPTLVSYLAGYGVVPAPAGASPNATNKLRKDKLKALVGVTAISIP
jgi:hypothetical protein